MFNKYQIRHSDGTPLKGEKYFVLRLDSDNPEEAARVRAAMEAYKGESLPEVADTSAPKKFEVTDIIINEGKKRFGGIPLYRIRALKDIPRHNVKAGDLGGWVQSEKNLSQDGDCWIEGDSVVICNAHISGDALVYDKAVIRGCARITGEAKVGENAYVADSAFVTDRVSILESAQIFGEVGISGTAIIGGHAHISGRAMVFGGAIVSGDALIFGAAHISGQAFVSGSARVSEKARIRGNARVVADCAIRGNAIIGGGVGILDNVVIAGNAEVNSAYDFRCIRDTWDKGAIITYTRSNKRWQVKSFHGTGEELIAWGYKESELAGKSYKALVECFTALDAAIEESKCAPKN